MAMFEWDDSFAIGVGELDAQHQRLIVAINAFYEGLRGGKPQAALAQLLKFMIDYLNLHFKAEEQFMERHGYPDLAQHRQEHQAFVRETSEMVDRFVTGKMLLSLEVTSFLRNWLTQHILVSDKKLGRFLVAQGEK